MASYTRPHSHIPGAAALTGTSVDELIRPGLQQAFPLPTEDDSREAKFRHLLEALAKRHVEQSQVSGWDLRFG